MSNEQIKNLEQIFEARIARDEKIEPKDWMPGNTKDYFRLDHHLWGKNKFNRERHRYIELIILSKGIYRDHESNCYNANKT